MIRLLLIVSLSLCILFIGGMLSADEVWSGHTEEIHLKSDYDKVCNFIESHSDGMIEAANNKVLKREGNKVKIQSLTHRDTIIFTIQENVVRGNYSSNMTESHSGGLTSQKTKITVSKDKKGKTLVTIRVDAAIDSPLVNSPAELKIGLAKSCRGIKEYLKRHL